MMESKKLNAKGIEQAMTLIIYDYSQSNGELPYCIILPGNMYTILMDSMERETRAAGNPTSRERGDFEYKGVKVYGVYLAKAESIYAGDKALLDAVIAHEQDLFSRQ